MEHLREAGNDKLSWNYFYGPKYAPIIIDEPLMVG